MLLWRPIWPKRSQKFVYGDGMFLSTILLKHHHPLTMYCTPISTLPQQCNVCAPPHQSMVDYTGHFMAYVILSFYRFFSSYECTNEKGPTGCGVNFRLYQNMPNFMINYESVSARPRFRLNPQTNTSTLYSSNANVGIFVIK